MKVTRFDRCEIRKDSFEKTTEGYLKGRARLTRTGVFPYLADDGSIRLELRHPREVYAKASMATLDKLPMQVEHRAMLNADNMQQFKVGNLGTECCVDDPFIEADYVIDAKPGVDAVEIEGRQELSLGYRCGLREAPAGSVYDGQPFTHEQFDIQYNHVAITKQARLGPELRLDSAIEQAIRQDGDPNHSPEDACMTQKVKTDNGLHYDAVPEVAAYVGKLETRADTLQRELDTARADAKTAKATADAAIAKLEGERDQFKADAAKATKDLKDKVDGMDAAIRKASKDRADLIGAASEVLEDDVVAKLDTMSDLEIMKAVVVADSPDVKFDGAKAEPIYIQARFDGIMEKVRKDGSPGLANARAGLSARQDADETTVPPFGKKKTPPDGEATKTDSEVSRKKMHAARQDAWMKPANGKTKED